MSWMELTWAWFWTWPWRRPEECGVERAKGFEVIGEQKSREHHQHQRQRLMFIEYRLYSTNEKSIILQDRLSHLDTETA